MKNYYDKDGYEWYLIGMEHGEMCVMPNMDTALWVLRHAGPGVFGLVREHQDRVGSPEWMNLNWEKNPEE